MPNWKKLIVSGSDAILKSLTVINGVTGNLIGTAATSSLVATALNSSNNTFRITFVTESAESLGEKIYKSNDLTYNPSSGDLKSRTFSGTTGGVTFVGTGSWAETALTASRALTASYTPNSLITASVSSNVLTFTKGNGTTFNLTVATGSGGGTTSPGGSDRQIQFNSGSTFSGSANLEYEYNTSTTKGGRIFYKNDYDFTSNSYTRDHRASLVFDNVWDGRNQRTGIVALNSRIAGGVGASTIFKFDSNVNLGGGNNIKVTGFKADYCLSLFDGTYISGTRTGTLWGAWDFDSNYTPVLDERSITGDETYGELGGVTFTLAIASSDIDLQIDASGVSNIRDVYWNLLLTIFTQTAFI